MASNTSQTQVRQNQKVPLGYIMVSEKWQGSELEKQLKNISRVVFCDSLGVVDFHVSSSCAVVYISEADQVNEASYIHKLRSLKKVEQIRVVVIVQKGELVSDKFAEIQECVVQQYELPLIPVTDCNELAQLLSQMVYAEGNIGRNPFRLPPKHRSGTTQVKTLCCIPGMGEKKAAQLLEAFGSLYIISNTDKEQLGKVIGASTAENVHAFLSGS